MRPFELLKLFALRTTRYTLHAVFILAFLTLALTSQTYAAPQMADYCYLPPFVTDPNTPPNIMITFEKGPNIMRRAYSDTYNSTTTYYGFFDSSAIAKYKYDQTCDSNEGGFIRDDSCTANAGNNYNCFSGNLLNWALMTSIDLSRKALIGFGWPHTGVSAGTKFTYTGELISYSQWSGVNPRVVGGGYTFYFNQAASGSLPTRKLAIRYGELSTWNGKCTGGTICPVSPGAKTQVAVKLPTPTSINDETAINQRIGIIQKYADKDRNLIYDSDAPRFGIRRWDTGVAKQSDILCDRTSALAGCGSPNCGSTDKTLLFGNILDVISQDPQDPTPYLGNMMGEIVKYFQGISASYSDNKDYTQSSYSWCNDLAKACRKTFALFITTGAEVGTTALSPLHDDCCTDIAICPNTSVFSQNACSGFQEDLCDGVNETCNETGKQNILTYIVHTAFITGATNTDKLEYAASVGGGAYLSVDDPSKLQTKIEEAILNILSTSASASTVATLTTQTRESSTLTQAYFYPKKEGTPLRWIGYLRLLWSDSGANLREDTMNKGWLDLKKDKILSFWYSATGCSGGPCYRAMLFNDIEGDLKIDSCYAPTVDNTIDNETVATIWNAQTKLQNATPDETKTPSDTPSGRLIKVGRDADNDGIVENNEIDNFTTAVKSTFQPFWNPGSTCVNNPARWCSSASHCYFCNTNVNRSCPNGLTSNDECRNYCTSDASVSCTADGNCNLGSCSSMVCDNDITRLCSLSSDCLAGGTCVGTCNSDPNKTCVAETGCNFGSCQLTDTCNTGDTCNAECDDNCAESVIKFARGYDKPTPSGSDFRLRQSTDSGNSNETNTLKLGDIVYSTPRISPNSAVNGYDVTYKDTTYTNFIDAKIKGEFPCTADSECPEGQTCSSKACSASGDACTASTDCPTTGESCNNVCSGDGYTSIVIVGANDGMVHAFKVSKIKDIDPAENNCFGAACDSVSDGAQVARFADKPRSAKSRDTGTGTDTVPPTDIGKELWAYLPWNAVPYLKWYCSESYCHIPMVDARFTVIDASVGKNDGTGIDTAGTDITANRNSDGKSWRRLLVGAMGVGGKSITVGSNTWSSSIFVLDITNPASPTLLWERPLPDGTLTTSTPAVVRLASAATEASKNENGTWYLVIGSGPESVTTNKVNYKTSEKAKIFVFNLRTGAVEATLTTSDATLPSGVAVGDMMAVDFDSDYQVDDIYFGTYGGTGASQTGNLYRLRIRDGSSYQTTPSNWDIETVVNVGRPIYASAEIAQDALGNKWIYFGTGLYLTLEHAKPRCSNNEDLTCNSDSDCTSPGTCGVKEYLYAVKETTDCWKSGGTSCTYSSFLDTSGISFTGATAVEVGCFCAGSLLKPFSCTNGNCDGTCTGGACSNNTSVTCASNDDCKCSSAEQKVVTKVTDATLTETSGDVTSCDGKKDKAAIDCLTTQINSTNGCSDSPCNGWYRTIPKQKSFSKPFVAGGLADFTTFEPKSTVCSLGGDTHLWALHYTTGTAYVQPTISMAGGTSGTGVSDIEIKASVNLGTGVPPLGESLVALPLAGDTYKVITQVSGGLPGTQMAPSLPARSGYVLWLVK